jgi:hypothetical protein
MPKSVKHTISWLSGLSHAPPQHQAQLAAGTVHGMVEAVSDMHKHASKLLQSSEGVQGALSRLERRSGVAVRLSPSGPTTYKAADGVASGFQFTGRNKMHIRLKPLVSTSLTPGGGSGRAATSSFPSSSSGSPPPRSPASRRPPWRSSSAPQSAAIDDLPNSRYKRSDAASNQAPRLSDRSQQLDELFRQLQVRRRERLELFRGSGSLWLPI